MRGVTSSSVAATDWRQVTISSAGASRRWTVAAKLHMAAQSSHIDGRRVLLTDPAECTTILSASRNFIFSLPSSCGQRRSDRVLDFILVLPAVLVLGEEESFVG